NAAATHEHDGVLLEVVADAGDVGSDFHVVRQANTSDLPKSRVRLLRGHRADDRADAALLGRATAQFHEATFLRVPGRPERRCVDFLALRLASLAYELRDRGHDDSFFLVTRARTKCADEYLACCLGSPLDRRARPAWARSPGAARPQSQDRDRADARNDRPRGRSPSRKTGRIKSLSARYAEGQPST